jgi:hypothetical protein
MRCQRAADEAYRVGGFVGLAGFSARWAGSAFVFMSGLPVRGVSSLRDFFSIWYPGSYFVSLSGKMDLLVAKSTSALLSAGMAMMGLVVALAVCFRWKEMHIGPDGMYLV